MYIVRATCRQRYFYYYWIQISRDTWNFFRSNPDFVWTKCVTGETITTGVSWGLDFIAMICYMFENKNENIAFFLEITLCLVEWNNGRGKSWMEEMGMWFFGWDYQREYVWKSILCEICVIILHVLLFTLESDFINIFIVFSHLMVYSDKIFKL